MWCSNSCRQRYLRDRKYLQLEEYLEDGSAFSRHMARELFRPAIDAARERAALRERRVRFYVAPLEAPDQLEEAEQLEAAEAAEEADQ